MKLEQNQVWQKPEGFFRIVRLARLEVEFKQLADLGSADGTHHQVSKKAFCRLVKGAVLLPPDRIRELAGGGS